MTKFRHWRRALVQECCQDPQLGLSLRLGVILLELQDDTLVTDVSLKAGCSKCESCSIHGSQIHFEIWAAEIKKFYQL